jgi:LysR family cys regulon transcriptional activator
MNLHQFRFVQAVRRNLDLTETARALHTSVIERAIGELEGGTGRGGNLRATASGSNA